MLASQPINSNSALSEELIRSQQSLNNPIAPIPSRDRLLACLVDFLPEPKSTLHTRMMAIEYFDTFLHLLPETDPKAYDLVAVLCLVLALRFDVSYSITNNQIAEMLGFKYSVDTIMTVERYILFTLDWKLAVSTPAPFIRIILDDTFGENYSSSMLVKADMFALVGVLNSEVKAFGKICIAAAAIAASLEYLGYKELLGSCWAVLNNKTAIDIEVIKEVQQKMLQLISN